MGGCIRLSQDIKPISQSLGDVVAENCRPQAPQDHLGVDLLPTLKFQINRLRGKSGRFLLRRERLSRGEQPVEILQLEDFPTEKNCRHHTTGYHRQAVSGHCCRVRGHGAGYGVGCAAELSDRLSGLPRAN